MPCCGTQYYTADTRISGIYFLLRMWHDLDSLKGWLALPMYHSSPSWMADNSWIKKNRKMIRLIITESDSVRRKIVNLKGKLRWYTRIHQM